MVTLSVLHYMEVKDKRVHKIESMLVCNCFLCRKKGKLSKADERVVWMMSKSDKTRKSVLININRREKKKVKQGE